jgi:hypothetical protein
MYVCVYVVVLDGKNFPDWDFELRGVLKKSGALEYFTAAIKPTHTGAPSMPVQDWAYSGTRFSSDLNLTIVPSCHASRINLSHQRA